MKDCNESSIRACSGAPEDPSRTLRPVQGYKESPPSKSQKVAEIFLLTSEAAVLLATLLLLNISRYPLIAKLCISAIPVIPLHVIVRIQNQNYRLLQERKR